MLNWGLLALCSYMVLEVRHPQNPGIPLGVEIENSLMIMEMNIFSSNQGPDRSILRWPQFGNLWGQKKWFGCGLKSDNGIWWLRQSWPHFIIWRTDVLIGVWWPTELRRGPSLQHEHLQLFDLIRLTGEPIGNVFRLDTLALFLYLLSMFWL